ncbi:hypothetical protein NGM10_10030 [Halorussus salilacus]|uniref:hypothetical protein n=1 Tax=Halorussus salilacus TaxID=2953750 RepID=UPI00209FE8AB|nr:hypothetical protein [Halorussus salilacus]USZ67068.1 hypothetical protein NGM10_10030 [Halorussus salilacus]
MAENKYPQRALSDMVSIIQNVVDMVGYFSEVALSSPLSALLMLFGFLFVAGSSLVMAYLAAGAAVDYVTPESLGRRPPQQG